MPSWLLLTVLFACQGETLECAESSMIKAYTDADGDGYGDGATQELVCTLNASLASVAGDCDDTRDEVNPEQLEQCDGLDNDCDTQIDEDLRQLEYYEDADADGFGNAAVAQPACTPPPGFVENPLDCFDDDELSNPAADEFCDGKDNDCDALVDDDDPNTDINTMPFWYWDGDLDGYGDETKFMQACEGIPGSVNNPDDCDDANPDMHPGAGEICNLVDDDCDGHLDDSDSDIDPSSLTTFYADNDLDGYGDPGNTTAACDAPWFYVGNDDDCDDAEPLLGNAASGWWVLDNDSDGFGAEGAPAAGPSCTAPSANHVLQAYATDCDDANGANYPDASEICDAQDNDCDDLVDDADDSVDLTTAGEFFLDDDGDGFGTPDETLISCAVPDNGSVLDTDCDDTEEIVNPDQPEVCNGFDDNCDGLSDEEDPNLDATTVRTYWFDYDGDGYGDPTIDIVSCSPPPNYVDNDLDCDDNDQDGGIFVDWLRDVDGDGFGAGAPQGPTCEPPQPTGWAPETVGLDCDDVLADIHPGAEEFCEDGIDQDCDAVDAPCANDVADTCPEAMAEPSLVSGLHFLFGNMNGLANDINWVNGNACTGKATAGGDIIVPVTIGIGESLKAMYTSDGDSSMSLVSTCTNPSPATCNGGADLLDVVGDTENLWFQNNTGLVQNLYLVLDCAAGSCGAYTLDLEIAAVVGSFQPDTCAQAQGAMALTTGGWTIIGRNTNTMVDNITDPTICTGYTAGGKESFVPVELQPGERVEVAYTQVDDASMYLLTDCASVNTCVVGADNEFVVGATEKMAFTNNGVGVETLYLGVDCYTAGGEGCSAYELSITID